MILNIYIVSEINLIGVVERNISELDYIISKWSLHLYKYFFWYISQWLFWIILALTIVHSDLLAEKLGNVEITIEVCNLGTLRAVSNLIDPMKNIFFVFTPNLNTFSLVGIGDERLQRKSSKYWVDVAVKLKYYKHHRRYEH